MAGRNFVADTAADAAKWLAARGEDGYAKLFQQYGDQLTARPVSKNTVVFDPKIMTIVRKYAVPAAMLSGAAGHGLNTQTSDAAVP